jgi:hypothetical protein
MNSNSAKELLAKADELMRRSQSTDDLPVLTELVSDSPGDTLNPGDTPKTARDASRDRIEPSFDFDVAKSSRNAADAKLAKRVDQDPSGSYTREQFDAAVAAKLDQMAHSVYSQVMQQLELTATGQMKRKLREALEPALTQVALDIAAQVAEETSLQVQDVVSNAVEKEVARLREQIQNKRRDSK